MELSLSRERAKQMKVWIMIPAAGDKIHATFASCLMRLMNLLRDSGVAADYRFQPNDSLVTRARNNLASIFLNASSDDNNHFSLWLDCDILFNPESVVQMLAVDRDFVTAPYSKKGLHMDRIHAAATLGWKSEDITLPAGTPNVNFLINQFGIAEPVPVLEAGSGFWLVKRKVFRMMAEQLPIEYKRLEEEKAFYGTDIAHDFFRVGIWPETKEYLSEDWYFCREWRNLGGTVWCCFWIKTHHIGPYLYPMDMDALVGLLNQTGGAIHGETWSKEKRNAKGTDVGGEKGTLEPIAERALGEEAAVGR